MINFLESFVYNFFFMDNSDKLSIKIMSISNFNKKSKKEISRTRLHKKLDSLLVL